MRKGKTANYMSLSCEALQQYLSVCHTMSQLYVVEMCFRIENLNLLTLSLIFWLKILLLNIDWSVQTSCVQST